MHSTSLAVAVSLLVSAATPIFAATKHTQAKEPALSYDVCEALAVKRGSPPGQGGSTYTETQFRAFMQQCLAGKIPLTDPVQYGKSDY